MLIVRAAGRAYHDSAPMSQRAQIKKTLWLPLVIGGALAAAGGAAQKRAPTFSEDVLPVLAKRCQACHSPGEVAPMPLLTYEQTRPWAKAIRESVLSGQMPPWFAEPGVGRQFSNDRSLTRQEIDALVGWADAGAPRGGTAAAPRPPRPTGSWRLGEPDLIYEMAEYQVPASGTIEYTYYIIPTEFKEDRWVTAAELKVSASPLVHHINAFIREPGNKRFLRGYPARTYFVPAGQGELGGGDLPADDPASLGGPNGGVFGEILAPYEPGFFPSPWAPGRAKLIKAGSDIVVQVHYTANGTAAADRTQLGLTFAKEPPRERVLTWAPANAKFVIPPGAASHRVDYAVTVMKDLKLLSMQPHMHLRGKSFEYRVVHPGGAAEVLLRVPRYDFNWQLNYYLSEPLPLAPGARLEFTAHYDNSAKNPWNPDPTATVKWGDQSWEEMMIGFIEVAFDARLDANSVIHRMPAGGR